MLDEQFATVAAPPALELCKLVRHLSLPVHGTFAVAGMRRLPADCAHLVAACALCRLRCYAHKISLDEEATIWRGTIVSGVDWYSEFFVFRPELLLQCTRDILGDCLRRDLVEAALWRPTGFVLHSSANEALEAFLTVMMTFR
jgi:hypothetical protein